MRNNQLGRAISALVFSFVCMISHGDDLSRAKDLVNHYEFTKAREILLELLNDRDQAAECYHQLGHIEYRQDHFEKALSFYQRAVELDATVADYHFAVGRTYGEQAIRTNVVKQAILAPKIKKAFELAVKLDPKHVEATIALANFYFQAPGFMGGDNDEAYKLVDRLIERDEPWGYFLLTDFHRKKEKERDAKLQLLKACRILGRDRVAYHLSYGRYLISQKRFDEAKTQLDAALKIDADHVQTLITKGDVLLATGKTRDALAVYRRSLELAPEHPYLAAKIRYVEDPGS